MNNRPLSGYFARKEVSPYVELGAWEWLWLNQADSRRALADLVRKQPELLPSDLVPELAARSTAREALARLSKAGAGKIGIRVHGAGEYPARLRDATNPPALLCYQGWWDLVNAPRSVAIVGTREITADGIRRTRKLVRLLVQHDCVIFSGLTRGVNAVAHETALECGGATVAVAATPLSDCDPQADWKLQRRIASDFLLISHVPVLSYSRQERHQNRAFFSERSRTLSALAGASVIVEAGEISGTLIQAQAALAQGRKLFILNGCFDQPGLTWPARFEALGAIRVRNYEQILNAVCL
jgi:DNA processing protein